MSIQSFSEFQLDSKLLEAIAAMGYTTPTPIQERAIPVVVSGQDVMGAAQTGTGKTAGYGLPALQRILPYANTSASPARHPVRVLILAPTRELADQVNVNLKAYAAKTALRVAVVFGGVDIKPQQMELMRGVEVLTATPGRLLDHVEGHTVNLSQVEIVILDEADRMLDMGFLPDISRILNLLPKRRQSLMFSATFSPDIKKLAKNFLTNPVLIEVARQNATADTVEQVVYNVSERAKTDVLVDILQERQIEEDRQVLVFVNAKLTCRRLSRALASRGLNADCIHGDKTQEERMSTLEAFKSGDCEILVATDVAARGLDIAELPCVINYDVPFVAEDYVHRIGRTGRAGAKGLAITLACNADERLIQAIEKLTKQHLKQDKREAASRFEREGRRRRSRREEDREGHRLPDMPQHVPQMPYDPIFDAPYEEKASEITPIATSDVSEKREEVVVSPLRGKKRVVSALLGGFGAK